MWCPKFRPGDKVLAKMRGYPPWPASVEGVADETRNKVKYHIHFYGTEQMAICREEELCSYIENRETCNKPKKYKGFNEGILQIDSELGLACNKTSDSSRFGSDNVQDNVCVEGTDVLLQPLNAVKSKEKLLSLLKVEAQLVHIEILIQSSLNLKNADPDLCLKYLDKLFDLEVNPLILKKHPEVLDLLIKLQNYVGNTNNWNMNEEQVKQFLFKSASIRQKAKLIYEKIQSKFDIPHGKTFLFYFQDIIREFNSCTKDAGMTDDDFFRLTTDPTHSLEKNRRQELS